MTDRDICQLIQNDPWMMEILVIVKNLELPDWWIGAGFVRSKVWDHLHGYKNRTSLPDVDVIYFGHYNPSANEIVAIQMQEKLYEEKLKKSKPDVSWSVKNQARMHNLHNHKPYKNSTEALSFWVETATCVGVTLGAYNIVILTAPRGVEDLTNLILRPTPDNMKDSKTFYERVNKKQWLKKWPKLRMYNE